MQIWQKCTSRNESNRRTDFNNFIKVIFLPLQPMLRMRKTFYRNAYRLIKQKHRGKAFKKLEGGR
jgi:hypothetical protein